jgi:hypothetical protein
MSDKSELCEKIRALYPDIGQCGLDIKVEFDQEKEAWVVDLKRDRFELKTYLDDEDADLCLLGRKCVGLGIEIAQLRANIERLKDDTAARY